MVQLGIYFIEKDKINYARDLFHWKWWNKVRMGIYFIENNKIRYGLGFIS